MTTQLPFDRDHPLAPLAGLGALAAAGPIHPVRTAVGHHAWLVTGYAEVRQLLADDRLGRSHPDPNNAARSGESALFGGPLGNFETEATDSVRMRALLQPHFTPKRIRALRPRVEELTDGLLTDLAASQPPADLHRALAVPLPILVICELLGVPYDDRGRFRALSEAAADVTDRDRSNRGLADLFAYGLQLVTRKRKEPDDGVISALCRDSEISDNEVAVFSMALLFAGHETTVVQIGLGVLHLLANTEQWRLLRDDPARVEAAVEEILRAPMRGGAGGIPRYAREDLELGGQLIRAGDLVLLANGAANHDPSMFADPDRFDVRRGHCPHLTFGHGPRYCIGAPLARLELATVLSGLVSRFPTLRLAVPVTELSLRRDTLTEGLATLPVTW